jgi:large subunit ribosomal protein L6
MSRIGKIPIIIPTGVSVDVDGATVVVNGPKGRLDLTLPAGVSLDVGGDTAKVVSDAGSMQGLFRTLVANMVKGVTEEWTKTLELSGTGYRASVSGDKLLLALGFSHQITVLAPEGIDFEVRENKITVRGRDKVLVGQLAAKIRHFRPADPYKAKGLKYEGEVIIRKAGKAAKAGGTTGK